MAQPEYALSGHLPEDEDDDEDTHVMNSCVSPAPVG